MTWYYSTLTPAGQEFFDGFKEDKKDVFINVPPVLHRNVKAILVQNPHLASTVRLVTGEFASHLVNENFQVVHPKLAIQLDLLVRDMKIESRL